MITARIKAMLEACEAGQPSFPPTVLFSEGWLLRVVLDWFAGHGGDRYPLSPMLGGRWFSEAWLPSAFLPRFRGDALAESRTHADGVVGHFTIGDPGSSGLNLAGDAHQLVVLEAKLFNRLSSGIRNALYYDQAARSVACMAEVLRRAARPPESMTDLAFLVVAPRDRIEDGVFSRDLRCLAWEDVIETIAFHDPVAGQFIDSFYGKCLRFNRPRERSAFPGRHARGGDAPPARRPRGQRQPGP